MSIQEVEEDLALYQERCKKLERAFGSYINAVTNFEEAVQQAIKKARSLSSLAEELRIFHKLKQQILTGEKGNGRSICQLDLAEDAPKDVPAVEKKETYGFLIRHDILLFRGSGFPCYDAAEEAAFQVVSELRDEGLTAQVISVGREYRDPNMEESYAYVLDRGTCFLSEGGYPTAEAAEKAGRKVASDLCTVGLDTTFVRVEKERN